VHLVVRNERALGHAAVGHEAVETDDPAQVVLPRTARNALAATVDRLDRDAIAFRYVGHAMSDRADDTGDLVPRTTAAWRPVNGCGSLGGMEIGPS
jgi:hypothetical protein